jgi:hypothetical protein
VLKEGKIRKRRRRRNNGGGLGGGTGGSRRTKRTMAGADVWQRAQQRRKPKESKLDEQIKQTILTRWAPAWI